MRRSSRMFDPDLIAAGTNALTVTVLGPRLILTTFIGRSTSALSIQASERFESLIAKMHRPVWVSDASRLTGFEPRSLSLGPRWFVAFRERGGKDCVVVSSWNIAMMAASTMALGLGVHIHNRPTIEQATALARQLIER